MHFLFASQSSLRMERPEDIPKVMAEPAASPALFRRQQQRQLGGVQAAVAQTGVEAGSGAAPSEQQAKIQMTPGAGLSATLLSDGPGLPWRMPVMSGIDDGSSPRGASEEAQPRDELLPAARSYLSTGPALNPLLLDMSEARVQDLPTAAIIGGPNGMTCSLAASPGGSGKKRLGLLSIVMQQQQPLQTAATP